MLGYTVCILLWDLKRCALKAKDVVIQAIIAVLYLRVRVALLHRDEMRNTASSTDPSPRFPSANQVGRTVIKQSARFNSCSHNHHENMKQIQPIAMYVERVRNRA